MDLEFSVCALQFKTGKLSSSTVKQCLARFNEFAYQYISFVLLVALSTFDNITQTKISNEFHIKVKVGDGSVARYASKSQMTLNSL